jgi:hypothetical protein
LASSRPSRPFPRAGWKKKASAQRRHDLRRPSQRSLRSASARHSIGGGRGPLFFSLPSGRAYSGTNSHVSVLVNDTFAGNSALWLALLVISAWASDHRRLSHNLPTLLAVRRHARLHLHTPARWPPVEQGETERELNSTLTWGTLCPPAREIEDVNPLSVVQSSDSNPPPHTPPSGAGRGQFALVLACSAPVVYTCMVLHNTCQYVTAASSMHTPRTRLRPDGERGR